MRKFLLFSFLFVAFASANAQDILYNTSYFNILGTNPAFAGARKEFNLTALLGNRFNGTITPQQVSQVFSMDGQVGNHTNGLGLQAFNDGTGGFSRLGVLADYAYRIPVGDLASVSLGVRVGFTTYSYLGTSQFYPYAGAGGLFNTDNLFLSISKPVIISSDAASISPFGINQKPLFASAGVSLAASDKILVNPSLLYEVNDQSGNALNLNAKVWFNKKIGLGVSFKNRSASTVLSRAAYSKVIETFELQASRYIRLGLSYDNNPYSDFQVSGGNYGTGGLLQLFFRYETVSERESTNRLKFF